VTTWAAVAAGGAIGSMARHLVNRWGQTRWMGATIPVGTATANLTGCFIIGLLAGLLASNRIVLPSSWREFVFVGLLGGFTTFSSFGLETFVLGRASAGDAALNVMVHVVGGLLAVWVGYQIGLAGR